MVELSNSVQDVTDNTQPVPQEPQQQTIMDGIRNNPGISEAMVNESWLTSDISNLDLTANFVTEPVPNYLDQNLLSATNEGGCSGFPTKSSKNEPEYVKANQVVNAWGYDLESNDPFSVGVCVDNNKVDSYIETQNSLSLWPSGTDENVADDSVFQVDKNDLIQNPTLAELNANDDPWLEFLDYNDLFNANEKMLFPNPSESKYVAPVNQNGMMPPTRVESAISEYNVKPEQKMTCLLQPTNLTTDDQNKSSNMTYYSNPSPKSGAMADLQLKSVGVSTVGFKESGPQTIPGMKMDEEKQQTLLSHLLAKNESIMSAQMNECPSYGSLGTGSGTQQAEVTQNSLHLARMLSNQSNNTCDSEDVSQPAGCKKSDMDQSDEGSSDEDTHDSDDDAESLSSSKWTLNSGSQRNDKRKRYFWQYNVQAKGPKGPRIVLASEPSDPHILNIVTDPVFSPACQLEGVKHAGKARRGDGNDLTPNPRKLYLIGLELKKLNRHINDLKPVNELPSNARTRSRKEKNKLASRACRLKKKAQHEANKLKLYGLQREHQHLMDLLEGAKSILRKRLEFKQESLSVSCLELFDRMIKSNRLPKIAGRTTEFVNSVLDQVTAGKSSGGLDEL